MDADDILRLRLTNQHLSAQPLDDLTQLVARLGAVQAQDYPAARWAVGQRLQNSSDAQIQHAFADGKILRTHVLRPTWHFVAPADIRWLLAFTGPRIKAATAAYTRSLGLDDATLKQATTGIEKALRGGKQLTRSEIGDALRQAGATLRDGATLGHVIGHAELDALVCSGAPRGRQHTYALLEERVPPAPALTRGEALTELTWRYFSSHGPALPQDCAWWSGLTVAEVRRGLELNKSRLICETLDGRSYWFEARPALPMPTAVLLLPNYDEYTVAYRHRDLYYDRALNWTGDPRQDVPFRDVIVLNGRVAGRWQRTASVPRVEWTIEPSKAEERALERALDRYVAFVSGQGASVTDSTQPSRPSPPRMRVHSPLVSNASTIAPSS
jgi:Winged helix DNA-binding domain